MSATWPPDIKEYMKPQELWEAIGPMPIELIDYDTFGVGQPPVSANLVLLKKFSLIWQTRHQSGGGPDLND